MPIEVGVPGDAHRPAARPFRIDWAAALGPVVALVVLVTSAVRLTVGSGEPFWLDEVWTGLHASQPSFRALLRGLYVDVNAPLYHVQTWAWAEAFGLSNAALRFPSVLFGLLFPLLALIPTREIDRPTRLIWCALLATWTPGLLQSQEARCYALLLALTTGGTILHARLLARPTTGRALAWAIVGATAILTHYYAAILFGCQGLAYLAFRRGEAVRTWPAVLAFVPAFGWMGYHLPQLAGFVQVNWFSTLPLIALPWILSFALGPAFAVLAILTLATPSALRGTTWRAGAGQGSERVLLWVVGAGAVAAAMLVAAGHFRPLFTVRYLAIFVPSLLLGLALWARGLSTKRPFAPVAVVLCCLGAVVLWAHEVNSTQQRVMNWERASAAIMRAGVRNVAFTWDSPIVAGLSPSQLGELGGFFFRREGYPAEVTGVVLQPGDNPNERLLQAASSPDAAIIWIYDLAVRGTAAISHPPALDKEGSAFRCQNQGRGQIGVLLCLRRSR